MKPSGIGGGRPAGVGGGKPEWAGQGKPEHAGKGKPEHAGKGRERAQARLQELATRLADRGQAAKGLQNALDKQKANAERVNTLIQAPEANGKAGPKQDLGEG